MATAGRHVNPRRAAADLKNGATKPTEGTKNLLHLALQPRFSAVFLRPEVCSCGGMLTDPFGTNAITRSIIGCGIRVHGVLGPGIYENVYGECMEYELKSQGLSFDTGRPVPIIYRGARLKSKYYIDIVVEDCVVVELKAVVALAEIHKRQVLTQLKLTGLPVGLLMNFNVVTLTDGGVKRIVNPQLAQECEADISEQD